ncbi:AAA family ATPase [Brevibacillus agri]|uniref:AAA family ATPase n=1 Tax=Brevibacillus agri TaxID=51101 RepID=UPI001EE532E4|nr:AAA family ATPase [Brevibacillus agri]MCG5251865.1 AAA family ATPase [Brevibacillus agri]MED1646663.1 AAA family ATPase [Brevibacillus agri]MED1656236.1 AAA family ATPase [Brevibacillus agri]MED1689430.1 AAA family ATPase [Brevibacillus agri]MED1692546.1 AAA family ATPase [Brevibacillus agri]
MDKIDVLLHMTKSNPENASAWYLLGLEYAATGKNNEALQAFTEALRCNDPALTPQIIGELGKLSLAPTPASAPVQSEPAVSGEATARKAGGVAVHEVEHVKLHETVREAAAENKSEATADDIAGNKPEAAADDKAENKASAAADDKAENKASAAADDKPEKAPVLATTRPPSASHAQGPGSERPFQVISGGQAGKRDREATPITFADVGGLHAVKNAIQMKIVKPFVSPGLFERFRKKVGGGILLYGPPGCGKTFIAKATAGECRARFIPIHVSDILDPYIGVSEQNLREVFASARATKPSVLFLDEMDAIGYNRSRSSTDTMRAVIDTLLTEIEGIETNTDKMLIIGATNMPWDVDPAFKRPGRFDKMIFVSPPDEEARATIFRIKLHERPIEQIDYALLAKETDLYSGADIENVVELATEEVITEIMRTGVERPLTMKDLKNAIQSTQPSTIDWLRTVKNYVKYANQGGLYNDVESFLSRYKRI